MRISNQPLQEGKTYEGFQVLSVRDLPEYRSHGVRCVHLSTGAEVYHLANEDRENLFAFAFRTPPSDHTGVAHILEHTVLCGSRRFPLKDPFVALLKGSMQTFLNAMTFPDKTVYPASSMVEKDFYNLMLVYGDAVFFPLLHEEAFKQEGCHVEFNRFEDTTSGLKLVGIVYNEMKGKYSSPEAIVADWSYRFLFPDTPYHFDSGGSPAAIPDLTFEDFRTFHQAYYHPSNCKIFFYGDISTIKHLAFLQEHFLEAFSRRSVDSTIPEQPRWSAPRRFEMTYPVGSDEQLSKKSTITVNWLTAPVTDAFTTVALEVLTEVLVGNAGSPLRKALIDSKLGEDLSPATGLENELKETVLTVGLRGTDPEHQDAIENLVFETLTTIREQGISDDLLLPALQRVTFRNKEIKGGRGPYGLKLMRRALNGWLHDSDPETTLEFGRWARLCEERVSRDKEFLPSLLDHYLLHNQHRSALLVRPDCHEAKREGERISLWLKKLESELPEKEKHDLVSSTIKLKEFQERSDSPETLNCIPTLAREDLPRQVERVPFEKALLPAGVPLFLHDIFCNGIVYVDIGFNTGSIEEKLSPYIPLFSKALCNLGLPGIPYDEVARNLSLLTGGFTYFLSARTEVGSSNGTQEHVFFRVKALRENISNAVALVTRILKEADFDDHQQLKNIVLELRNESKATVIPHGHHLVSLRAARNLSQAMRREEQWEGIAQLYFLRDLTREPNTVTEDIASTLKELRSFISRKNAVINVTGESSCFEETKSALGSLISGLPEGSHFTSTLNADKFEKSTVPAKAESFIIVAPVGFVSQAIRGAPYGSDEQAYQEVLAHSLRTGYLWEKVRMRGGAYGAFAVSHGTESVFIFSSYRDPNILQTLQAFHDSLKEAERELMSEDQIDKALIGTVGHEEKPLDPGEKGFRNFIRKLCGVTDELRQRRRDAILEVNRERLSLSSRHLLEVFHRGFTSVMSNGEAITQAAESMPELADCIQEIPL